MAESAGCGSMEDFSTWLREQGFSQNVVDVFKGQQKLAYSSIISYMLTVLSENEVGREEYLQLTDDDIAEMVKPIGARRKLINLRKTDTLMSHMQPPCMHLMMKLHCIASLYVCMLFRETSTNSLDPIWTNMMMMMMTISGAVK